MKKCLYSLILTLVFLSCQKQGILSPSNGQELPNRQSMLIDSTQGEAAKLWDIEMNAALVAKSIKKPETIVTIQPYDTHIMNNCAGELVHLRGTVTYKTTETRTNSLYTLIYEIDFDHVTGEGETSRTLYGGGGKSINITESSLSGVSKYSYGRQTYDVTYNSANGHSLIFKEDAQYLMDARGHVLIDYNHVNDTCK